MGHLQSLWLAQFWGVENTRAVISTKEVNVSQPGALLEAGRYLKLSPSAGEDLIINAKWNSSNRIAGTPEYLIAWRLAVKD